MNKNLMKKLSFMTMGDGGVYLYSSNNFYFVMNMVKKNEDYIKLCESVLSEITVTKIKEIDKGPHRQVQLRLETKPHPFFRSLRERIYTDNYKSLDWHAMKALDWEAMSFLYMSGGSLTKNYRPSIGMINPSYALTLNLKRLCYADQLEFKRVIKEKLDVEFNVCKNTNSKTGITYYYLKLRTKDVLKFIMHITPFITDSFKYKVEL